MTINFLFNRRESLQTKSELFKNGIRIYLNSLGYSQTFDSAVEGSFVDMTFQDHNSNIIMVESKAENLSLKSKKFSGELIKYYKLWKETGYQFWLFAQNVVTPSYWELLLSGIDNEDEIKKWIEWYNTNINAKELAASVEEIKQLKTFLLNSVVTVGNGVKLENAALEKEKTSAISISNIADSLVDIVNRRKTAVQRKSELLLNILPISVPEYYYCGYCRTEKQEIYDVLEGETIPPFLLSREGSLATFGDLEKTPLIEYIDEEIEKKETKMLQKNNPTLASQLVHIHLRRIMWNKGIYKIPRLSIFYYPLKDKNLDRLEIKNHTGKMRWVVKRYDHQEDSDYHKKGDVNFYQHRAIEIRTPTYWGGSFLELVPRKYYTLDGETECDGEIRAKIDAKFRNPLFDRNKNRSDLTKMWKYAIFDSTDFIQQPEEWVKEFSFGELFTYDVNWSPEVLDRTQTSLWEYWRSSQ
ncbi:MAG: hypothetical protein WBC50_09505 [Dehalococcoidales bacterium]